jgi:hypothetical protein
MTPVDYALCLIFGVILFWVFGGFALRLSGLLLFFGGILSMAHHAHLGALLPVGIGALSWLLGHWHYAVRHHEYKSPLARYLYCRWAPAWADPSSRWSVAITTDSDSEGNRAP